MATVSTIHQWNVVDSAVTVITVPSDCLNDSSLTMLDLTRFKRLKKIVIGDECFMYVGVFSITGLSELESVEI